MFEVGIQSHLATRYWPEAVCHAESYVFPVFHPILSASNVEMISSAFAAVEEFAI
jgi:hypothetical protein